MREHNDNYRSGSDLSTGRMTMPYTAPQPQICVVDIIKATATTLQLTPRKGVIHGVDLGPCTGFHASDTLVFVSMGTGNEFEVACDGVAKGDSTATPSKVLGDHVWNTTVENGQKISCTVTLGRATGKFEGDVAGPFCGGGEQCLRDAIEGHARLLGRVISDPPRPREPSIFFLYSPLLSLSLAVVALVTAGIALWVARRTMPG